GAERDRHSAVRRAEPPRAPRDDPHQGARDHEQRRRLPLPRGRGGRRHAPPPLRARAERLGRDSVPGDHATAHERQCGRPSCAHRSDPEPRGRVSAAAGRAVPHQPRVRRADGLPNPVDPRRTDAHAAGRDHRRAPAHQLQARLRATARGAGGDRTVGQAVRRAPREARRLARVAGGRGGREQPALRRDPPALRGLRTGLGDRDRVARPHHLGPLLPGREPHGGARERRGSRDHRALRLAPIVRANEPAILPRDFVEEIERLARRSFEDHLGGQQTLITPEEASTLAIPRGSLTPDEVRQIQSHVVHTYQFLAHIPWTKEFRRIPEIARSHHEKLDGSGYPYGMKADEIPVQSKIMAIADIYDALTAGDRPYKNAVPPDTALDILGEERRAGRIDAALLDLFIDAKVYGRTGADVIPQEGERR